MPTPRPHPTPLSEARSNLADAFQGRCLVGLIHQPTAFGVKLLLKDFLSGETQLIAFAKRDGIAILLPVLTAQLEHLKTSLLIRQPPTLPFLAWCHYQDALHGQQTIRWSDLDNYLRLAFGAFLVSPSEDPPHAWLEYQLHVHGSEITKWTTLDGHQQEAFISTLAFARSATLSWEWQREVTS